MTDRDRDVRKTLVETVLAFKKRGYQMVDDVVDDVVDDIADEIRALDLPLTSAREVTDVVEAGRCPMCHGRPGMMDAPTGSLVERLESTLRRFDETHGSYFVFNVADIRQAVAALASAPQPACVGVEEVITWHIREAAGYDANANASTRCGDEYAIVYRSKADFHRECAAKLSALPPPPSPQAGGEDVTPRMDGTFLQRAHFRIRALREGLRDILVTDVAASPNGPSAIAKNALAVDDGRAAFTEDTCPGHIASDRDKKICGRCGVHVDSLRPLSARREG